MPRRAAASTEAAAQRAKYQTLQEYMTRFLEELAGRDKSVGSKEACVVCVGGGRDIDQSKIEATGERAGSFGRHKVCSKKQGGMGQCFHCLEHHPVKNCPSKSLILNGLDFSDLCTHCGSFRDDGAHTTTTACSSPGKDRIFPVVFSFIRNQERTLRTIFSDHGIQEVLDDPKIKSPKERLEALTRWLCGRLANGSPVRRYHLMFLTACQAWRKFPQVEDVLRRHWTLQFE